MVREKAGPREVSLDRRDNLIADASQIGGSVYAARAAHWASYLRTCERALWRLLAAFLCPVEQGYQYEDREGSLVARNDSMEVVLDVDDVALLQCEVYWERHTRSALEFVRAFADRALAASRSVRVHTYDLPEDLSLERVGGAMSVLMPLASKVDLAVYAKALDRVRFEVRYKSDLPQDIRNAARPGGNRLYRLWEAARSDALDRLPWEGMAHLMEPASNGSVSGLLDLLEAVRRSCASQPTLERAVLEMLLLTGGVSSTGPEGAAPEHVVQALVAQGVVEHVRLRRREDRGPGRRFRLTARYSDLSAMVAARSQPMTAEPSV